MGMKGKEAERERENVERVCREKKASGSNGRYHCGITMQLALGQTNLTAGSRAAAPRRTLSIFSPDWKVPCTPTSWPCWSPWAPVDVVEVCGWGTREMTWYVSRLGDCVTLLASRGNLNRRHTEVGKRIENVSELRRSTWKWSGAWIRSFSF